MWNLKEQKTCQMYRHKIEKWLPGAGEWEKQGEVGKTVKNFSYEINKIWVSNVKHGDYSW